MKEHEMNSKLCNPDHEGSPVLSVLVPCYNERHTIEKILLKISQAEPLDKEVIVIDDFSVDGTREMLSNGLAHLYSRLITQPVNMGKGAAIRAGIEASRGQFIVIQDADLEYDPVEFSRLLKPLMEDKADVVFGSRFSGEGPHRVVYFWHMVGNKLLTLLSNMFTNINLTDMETCYKIFRRSLAEKFTLQENRFGIEPELTAKLARLKPRIYEIGISYYGRTYGEGKKISWRDGFRAVYAILKYNLFSR